MRKKTIVFWTVAGFAILFLCFALIFAYYRVKYPLKFKNEIQLASVEFGVEEKLIASVINVESSFSVNAVSSKGAIGLMQVLPSTAAWVSLTNSEFENEVDLEQLSNPQTNIRIGTCYIKYLLNKFNDVNVALCAYNAGEGVVSTWLKDGEISPDGKTLSKIPYLETKNYIEKIQKNLKIYEKRF